MRYPQLVEGFDGDDVEARAPVDECFGDGDAADGRHANEGNCSQDAGEFWVVTDAKVDIVLRPLQRLGGSAGCTGCTYLLEGLLGVATGGGACAPPRM